MKIVIDPIKYKAWLHRKMVKRIKANEELLNIFRGNDMDMNAEGATEAMPKAFDLAIKGFTRCAETAIQLNSRSAKLASLYTGICEPQKDKEEEKEKRDSAVLVHVLRDIEDKLRRNLDEISNNLEKLEKAW